MLGIDGVELDIKPEAVRAVAKKAMKLKTGARGLRTIMEDIMLDIMFVTPDDRTISKVIVDENTVKTKESIVERKEITEKTDEKTA
jgi:ATP-dependent Clp protease ATP-binding subunit ClpX